MQGDLRTMVSKKIVESLPYAYVQGECLNMGQTRQLQPSQPPLARHRRRYRPRNHLRLREEDFDL